MTIRRIVESEAPFMAAMEFLLDLTPQILTSIGHFAGATAISAVLPCRGADSYRKKMIPMIPEKTPAFLRKMSEAA
jgi:hypothetical protein